MQFVVDTDKKSVEMINDGRSEQIEMYSKRALELLSGLWLKIVWNEQHWKSFSWMGLPMWQLPEDMLRLQEVLCEIRPDVIIETGVNQGGSSVFFASMCKLVGNGRVISLDISIPDKVRRAIEDHPCSDIITLIESDSVSAHAISQVSSAINKDDRVFVFLDSDHSKDHVLRELEVYAPMVSVGSYIVACDGVMEALTDTPYGQSDWSTDNPAAAAREFASRNAKFRIQHPTPRFGVEYAVNNLTFWPDAWLQRIN